jgi:hypothetical protein
VGCQEAGKMHVERGGELNSKRKKNFLMGRRRRQVEPILQFEGRLSKIKFWRI